jgi:hypothetical protein
MVAGIKQPSTLIQSPTSTPLTITSVCRIIRNRWAIETNDSKMIAIREPSFIGFTSRLLFVFTQSKHEVILPQSPLQGRLRFPPNGRQ